MIQEAMVFLVSGITTVNFQCSLLCASVCLCEETSAK